MLGRDGEFTALSALLAEAAGGRAQVGFVEGEAGIGKSRLLAEVVVRANEEGFTVLAGCAHEFERDRPFGPIIEALGLSRDSADPERTKGSELLIGNGVGADAPAYAQFPELRFRLLEVVLDLVERLATSGPVLLAIEDLHWADPSTLLVINHLARRLGDLPVAVLATLRPSPGCPGLERLIEDLTPRRALRLFLDPLDEPAVSGLVAAIVGAAPGPGLLTLVRRAAGNPFFIAELIAALLDEDNVEYDDSRADAAAAMLPPSRQLTILRRVGPLPGDVLEVLRVAAILGSPFSLDDLAVVLAAPASDLLRALEEPMRAKLVLDVGDRLAFRHELVREAIYHDLPQAARKALHLQAARRLGAAGRGVSQVATHFLCGAAPGDTEAVGWLLRAARDAVSRAPQVAVELLDQARQLCGEQSTLRDTLDAELGVALMWSGRLAEGEARLHDLLDRHHDQDVDAPARLALGQTLLLQGQTDAAIEVLEGARDTAERPQLLAEAALARLARGDVDAAAGDAERARDAGHQLGDDPAVCLALCVESAVVGLRGHTQQALDLAERALEVATWSPARETRRHPAQFFLGLLLIDLDRPEEGQRMLETARRVGEDLGMVWDLPLYHLFCGIGHFHHGDDDAAAEAEASLALNGEAGTRINVVWAQAILALVNLQRGDLPAARRAIEAGEQMMTVIGPQARGTDWLMWARALLEECSGNADAALAILWAVWNGHAALGIVSERRLARRVTAALRTAGLRRGASGPRGRPATGWEALTRTELEVSRLAAEGLTNPDIGERLFISRRTVETHLSHVFGKLGMSSRIELATAAARRGM